MQVHGLAYNIKKCNHSRHEIAAMRFMVAISFKQGRLKLMDSHNHIDMCNYSSHEIATMVCIPWCIAIVSYRTTALASINDGHYD